MNALEIVNTILRDKLRLNTIPTLTNVQKIGAIVLRTVNEIQQELLDAYDWPQLKKQAYITLVDGQTIYSLASDFHRFLHTAPDPYYQISDGSSSDVPKITLVDDETWKNHIAVNVKTGRPYMCRLFGMDSNGNMQLQVYGTPNSTYAGTKIYYDYIQKVSDLSSDTDISPFNPLWLVEGGYMKVRVSQGRISQIDVTDYVNSVIAGLYRANPRRRRLRYRDF